MLVLVLVQMQHSESGAFIDCVYSNIREAFTIGISLLSYYKVELYHGNFLSP